MKKSFFIVIISFLLFSCSNKDTYIDDFGKFINDIENVNEDYSDQDWAQIEIQFDELYIYEFEEYEAELTENDLKQIEKFKERFTKLQVQRNPLENVKEIFGF